jgi:hypothetical protein
VAHTRGQTKQVKMRIVVLGWERIAGNLRAQLREPGSQPGPFKSSMPGEEDFLICKYVGERHCEMVVLLYHVLYD